MCIVSTVEKVLLYGSTACTLTQSLDKMLDGAYSKVLRVVKNVTWRQRIPNEVLCAGLPMISTSVREMCLWFSSHCWRSKNEVVSDLIPWKPKHGKRSVGGQARTFVDLLETDTGVPRDCLPAAMDDGWLEKDNHGMPTEVDQVVVVVINGLRVAIIRWWSDAPVPLFTLTPCDVFRNTPAQCRQKTRLYVWWANMDREE